MAGPEEGEVFEDFVAEGSGADDEDLGRRQFFLPPPRNEPETAVAVSVINQEDVIGHLRRV